MSRPLVSVNMATRGSACACEIRAIQRVRLHSGLTLIEIVIVMAVLLILAAAVTPSLIGGFERSRAVTAIEQLQDITDAMSEMRRDAGKWPGRLSHLAPAITTSDDNGYWGATRGQPRVCT